MPRSAMVGDKIRNKCDDIDQGLVFYTKLCEGCKKIENIFFVFTKINLYHTNCPGEW